MKKFLNANTLIAVIAVLVVASAVCYDDNDRWGDKGDRQHRKWWGMRTSNDIVRPGSVVHNLPMGGTQSGFAKVAGSAIYVGAQQPGSKIFVNVVYLETPGYVVIHEFPNGNPGAIIGVSELLPAGNVSNLELRLMRDARDGEELAAMLHVESGISGFDPSTDIPVRDPGGNAIFMNFPVFADAPDPSAIQVMF